MKFLQNSAKNKYLDIRSIAPVYWGSSGWIFLNSIALTYKPELKSYYKNFFLQIPYILPCATCGENFISIDKEDILQKVASLEITNWNYKAQPKDTRHIGCMAQDFYAAFHLDGTSETTINTLDIDGINMASIQALAKRTDELKTENASLKAELEAIKHKLDALEKNAKK